MYVFWSLVDSGKLYDYYIGNNGYVFRRSKITLVEYPVSVYLAKKKHASVKINGKSYKLKNLVAEHFLREYYPGCYVECIDGDPFNCREANLRVYSQNEHGRLTGWRSSAQKVIVDGKEYRSIRQAASANYVSYQTLSDYIYGNYKTSVLDGKNISLC